MSKKIIIMLSGDMSMEAESPEVAVFSQDQEKIAMIQKLLPATIKESTVKDNRFTAVMIANVAGVEDTLDDKDIKAMIDEAEAKELEIWE